MIIIKETTIEDVKNVQRLWADGDVMRFVGFPDGLHETDENMEKWLNWSISNRPLANCFSIYEDDTYCGETSYKIDTEHHNSASLDIKLFRFARGRGIATKALSHAIEEAFKNGAETVWVDPDPQNEKALALYDRLGFKRKDMPEHVIAMGEDPTAYIYMELRKNEDLQLYIPHREDGWFYVKMMSDPETMAYNAPWFPPDGCIPNPEEAWKKLCDTWRGPERFYAFLRRTSDGCFVGDVNYHYNPERDWYDMGIVIFAPERGKGYGKQGLQLLLNRAFRIDGIPRLHNYFETTRDAACSIHRSVGFREVGIVDGCIHLELTREEYLSENRL